MDCRDICKIIEKKFPLNLAEDFDNVGLLVGRRSNEVKRILLALEITNKVIDEAIEKGVDLIITHHPLIFKPLKNITDSSYIGNMVLKLIENKIGLYSAHTNFDAADGGMNDVLCEKIGLKNIEILEKGLDYSIGRVGTLEETIYFEEFYSLLKTKFSLDSIVVSGNPAKPIKKVAIVAGSGSDFLNTALKRGCDCLVTGDVKHHSALDYSNMGINIVDLTHYNSEIIFKESFKTFLEENTSLNIILSEVEENPLRIV